MPIYNIQNQNNLETNYSLGLLPQRNKKEFWYQDSSCRSKLSNMQLNSENRRVLKKTQDFSFQTTNTFIYTPQIQKQCNDWTKKLNWNFPVSSIKTVFTNHIFNKVYIWKQANNTIAYAICLFTKNFSHIAYVFYNPEYQKSNLSIRLVIQTIADSQKLGLKYCYLGRFSPKDNIGYYKRYLPNLEYFDYKTQTWVEYKK
ncbi:hypothetical protein KKC08_05445 [Patescibacteria group bacterium]|nr:hypothetical protein [Patescibacteria group bacterium]MCG2701716.1 hypothetical protein [Candidatus Parcubacteria bacterium]MBU4264621.1 hypothetical protein [Patescibacteria group bacterium]MBU4390576.1 hypothetical protein [Patescibacteria group bacterium]MBU4397581.1 hypothetical protein [Patescibacteria group bacterium]